MKILFPYMARWHAVNWTRYHSLLYALADAGHEIHVLQPPPLASAETNFQEIAPRLHPGVVLHEVALTPALWKARMPLEKLFKKAYYSLAAYRVALEMIPREGIDVVLLYNIPQYRFVFLKSVVVVFDYADDLVDMLSHELGRLDNGLLRGLAQRLLTSMMRRASLTLAVSTALARQAVGNVHVVPNGVSMAKAQAVPHTPIQAIRAEGRPVVGFVGAFEYFVDLDLMLDVARAMPDLHFLFVGTGREWQRVRDRVEKDGLGNVQLTGGVPHDQVFEYIRQMHVCLNLFVGIPVSHRACPIKVFEYLSQRKPVITTRLDELQHIDDSFLYYGDDVLEVAAQIRAILTDRGAAESRAQRGYGKTVSHYTWDRIAEEFMRLVSPHLRVRGEARDALGGAA